MDGFPGIDMARLYIVRLAAWARSERLVAPRFGPSSTCAPDRQGAIANPEGLRRQTQGKWSAEPRLVAVARKPLIIAWEVP